MQGVCDLILTWSHDIPRTQAVIAAAACQTTVCSSGHVWAAGAPQFTARCPDLDSADQQASLGHVDAGAVPAGVWFVHATLHYGDSVDDQWAMLAAVWAWLQSSDPVADGAGCMAYDEDGPVPVIECAEHLPDWFTPDIAAHRAVVTARGLHLLPSHALPHMSSFVQATQIAVATGSAHVHQACTAALAERLRAAAEPSPCHDALAILPPVAAALFCARPELVPQVAAALYAAPRSERVQARQTGMLSPAAAVAVRVPSPYVAFAQLAASDWALPSTAVRAGWPGPGQPLHDAALYGSRLTAGLGLVMRAAAGQGTHACSEPELHAAAEAADPKAWASLRAVASGPALSDGAYVLLRSARQPWPGHALLLERVPGSRWLSACEHGTAGPALVAAVAHLLGEAIMEHLRSPAALEGLPAGYAQLQDEPWWSAPATAAVHAVVHLPALDTAPSSTAWMQAQHDASAPQQAGEQVASTLRDALDELTRMVGSASELEGVTFPGVHAGNSGPEEWQELVAQVEAAASEPGDAGQALADTATALHAVWGNASSVKQAEQAAIAAAQASIPAYVQVKQPGDVYESSEPSDEEDDDESAELLANLIASVGAAQGEASPALSMLREMGIEPPADWLLGELPE